MNKSLHPVVVGPRPGFRWKDASMIAKQLRSVIEELALDPVKVLRENSIRGIPGACGECPIARYVKKKCNVSKVMVTSTSVSCEDIQIKLSKPLSVFIFKFDTGFYPDLIQLETVS